MYFVQSEKLFSDFGRKTTENELLLMYENFGNVQRRIDINCVAELDMGFDVVLFDTR